MCAGTRPYLCRHQRGHGDGAADLVAMVREAILHAGPLHVAEHEHDKDEIDVECAPYDLVVENGLLGSAQKDGQYARDMQINHSFPTSCTYSRGSRIMTSGSGFSRASTMPSVTEHTMFTVST